MKATNPAISLFDHFLPSLRYQDYRRVWSASLFAGAAAWGLIVARGWLVYEVSGSSLWVGITTFAAMIPLFLVPPIAGYLADRLERRRLLSAVFTLQLAHNLILAILVITSIIEIWHIVLLSFINGAARAAQMPATAALIPNLVPKERILNAIALNAATIHGSRLVGAGVVIPLIAGSSGAGAFLLCTGFYVLALLFSIRIQSTSTGKLEAQKSIAENFLAGIRYVYGHPTLYPLVMVVFLHCCLTMAFESLLPVLSDVRLGGGSAGFSYLMMAVGGGSLVGVLALAPITKAQSRGRLLLFTGVISGLAPMGLAAATSMWTAALAAASMGASQAGFMAISAAMIQAIIPDEIRGRVMSIYLWHIGGVMASFNLLNGSLADVVGAPILLWVAGLAFVAVIPISFIRPHLRRVYMSGVVTPAPAAARAA